MLELLNHNIPDEEIEKITYRKPLLWIQIQTINDKINIFYDNEDNFIKDKNKCEIWNETIKPKVKENRKALKFKNTLLNSLSAIQQTCEYYVNEQCEDCPLKDFADVCIFEYGYAPVLWLLSNDPNENLIDLEYEYGYE